MSLTPSDWSKVEKAAALAGVPKNQVFEQAVRHYFTCADVLQKMTGRAQSVQEDEVFG